jgi:hypothetical protein
MATNRALVMTVVLSGMLLCTASSRAGGVQHTNKEWQDLARMCRYAYSATIVLRLELNAVLGINDPDLPGFGRIPGNADLPAVQESASEEAAAETDERIDMNFALDVGMLHSDVCSLRELTMFNAEGAVTDDPDDDDYQVPHQIREMLDTMFDISNEVCAFARTRDVSAPDANPSYRDRTALRQNAKKLSTAFDELSKALAGQAGADEDQSSESD